MAGPDPLASWFPSRHREFYVGLAVAGVGLLAFVNSLWNGFAYDDWYIIVENPAIRRLSDLRAIFAAPYWLHAKADLLYRPLVIFSYALNYAVAGLAPFGYHLVNVLLHAGNSTLVYWLVRALFRRRGLALASAAAFALHPIHTEAVANVVGRAELLANGFLLLSWWGYLRWAEAATRARARWLGASIAAFTAAIFTKEHAVALLGLLVLTDLLRAAERGLPYAGTLWKRCRTAYVWYLPFLAAYLAARVLVLGVFLSSQIWWLANPLVQADPWTRGLTATKVLGKYLWLLLVPLHLSSDYFYNQIPVSRSLVEPGVLVALLALLALLAIAVWSWARYPALSFGLALFAVAILPVSNLLVPIGTIMAERILYLPSLGFCLVLGVAVTTLSARPRWGALAVPAVLLLLLAYGARTVVRNRDWQSTATLFVAAARSSPNSARAHQNLGEILFERGDLPGARLEFERSLAIYPNYGTGHASLGAVFEAEGRLDDAILAYRTARRVDPIYASQPHLNLGFLYLRMGRSSDALEEFRHAKRLGLSYASDINRLAEGFFRVGSPVEAQESLERAIQYTPDSFALRYNLGVVYFRQQRWDDAQRELEAASRLTPDSPVVHYRLGIVYEKQGKLPDAQATFETALRLRPQAPAARRALGGVLLRQGRTAEAEREFRLADDQEKLLR